MVEFKKLEPLLDAIDKTLKQLKTEPDLKASAKLRIRKLEQLHAEYMRCCFFAHVVGIKKPRARGGTRGVAKAARKAGKRR
jgi:hypothetical protein